MFRAFKYRLEPNVNQTRELEIALETHRRLYNACLQQRCDEWEQRKRSIKYTDQSRWYKQERQINPYFARLNFSSAQATMRRLDRAFRDFFVRVKAGEKPGHPRFKPLSRFGTFTYPAVGDGCKLTADNKLRLQHVGTVRINLHRAWEGQIKTITICREVDKWFVLLRCELSEPAPATQQTEAVGIDVGVEAFLTTSNGERFAPIQPLRREIRKLRVEHRSLARKTFGGQNYKKQRRRVVRRYAKMANIRLDLQHKIAKKLVDRYGLIAVESLGITGMVRNRRMAREVMDAGWGRFFQILRYKAESAGVRVIAVDARGTSQLCSECGAKVIKPLKQRRHSCPCGYVAHRDRNAARNILARALLAGTQPVGLNASCISHGQRSR